MDNNKVKPDDLRKGTEFSTIDPDWRESPQTPEPPKQPEYVPNPQEES
ncbi:MAG TPA: hypothetical protein VMQ44_02370 [Candidatus Saccharimonadales bacterium]|nr:hypothetical protein [Candidatus Saccharimonadales bacterium]